MPLNQQQVDKLLQPIKPTRVLTAGGQAHVPAYDVAAHLTRILGFGGWDTDLLSFNCLFETSETRTKKDKDGLPFEYQVWTVGYSATVRVTIKDAEGWEVAHWENGACGDALNQPSRGDAHHLAMTTAISTAMKRCSAFGLGDQFGLSLYNKGSVKALVGVTLVTPDGIQSADLESHIETPASLGNDEREGNPGDEESPSVGQTTGADAKADTGQSSPQSSQPPEITPLQAEIRSHPTYVAMASARKGAFLADTVGYEVTSIRQLSDSDAEQVLAKLRTLA